MPYLFGYGSLISRESASATLKRELAPEEHSDAVLVGYKRAWQLVVPLLVGESYSVPIDGVFLDIVPAPGVACVGSVFELTEDELSYFDRRERQYRRLDVTELIIPQAGGRVYTFVGLPEHSRPGPAAVVMTGYERMIGAALSGKRDCFKTLWRSSTEPHRLRRLDGLYRFKDPEQHAHSGR